MLSQKKTAHTVLRNAGPIGSYAHIRSSDFFSAYQPCHPIHINSRAVSAHVDLHS